MRIILAKMEYHTNVMPFHGEILGNGSLHYPDVFVCRACTNRGIPADSRRSADRRARNRAEHNKQKQKQGQEAMAEEEAARHLEYRTPVTKIRKLGRRRGRKEVRRKARGRGRIAPEWQRC